MIRNKTRSVSRDTPMAWRRRRGAAAAMVLAALGTANATAAAPDVDAVHAAAPLDAGLRHGMVTVRGVRLHYVEGGSGRPVLLVPGWPESWYAWRDVMPGLIAAGRRVIAVDPRGMGDSDHPESGYDATTVAADLHEFVEQLQLNKGGGLDVVGHDVGAWIAFAYAADWPGDVRRLGLMEAAILGVSPPAPAGVPSDAANIRTWHFAFNRLPDLPEMLVQGHERDYLAWLFKQKSARPWVFTPEVLSEYTRVFAQPGGVRTAFSYYRAGFAETALAANRLRASKGLAMPVLTVGGQGGVGSMLHDSMRGVATDLRGVVIPDCGHFVMEECPAQVVAQLNAFLD